MNNSERNYNIKSYNYSSNKDKITMYDPETNINNNYKIKEVDTEILNDNLWYNDQEFDEANIDNFLKYNNIDLKDKRIRYNRTEYYDEDKTKIKKIWFGDNLENITFYENGNVQNIFVNGINLYLNKEGTITETVSKYSYKYIDKNGQEVSCGVSTKGYGFAKILTDKYKGIKIMDNGNTAINFENGKWIEAESTPYTITPVEGKTLSDYINFYNNEIATNEDNIDKLLEIKKGKFYIHLYPDDGIFSEENKASNTYGGDQTIFNDTSLLEDPTVVKIIENSAAGDKVKYEDYPELYEYYITRINDCGCGFVAYANTIFNYYEGHEQEFQNDFGYPMYEINDQGKKDYNYKYLVLDVFSRRFHIKDVKGIYDRTINADPEVYERRKMSFDYYDDKADNLYNYTKRLQIARRIEETNDWGDTYITREKINKIDHYDSDLNTNYLHYEKDKYADCVDNNENYTGEYNFSSNTSKKFKEVMFENNNNTIINALGFDLYSKGEELKYSINDANCGHAMLITGMTNEGDYIVSSWGSEYILKKDSIKCNDFTLVNYEDFK